MDPDTPFVHDDRVQDPLARPLKLACGATLPNRVAKAAMTEGLADPHDQPTERHTRLYQRWAEGGVGLSITGNVMVDRRFLERAGNGLPSAIMKGGTSLVTALEKPTMACAPTFTN